MPGGYYDPTTPGHHELNEEEFSKAMCGTFAGLLGAWGNYVGVDELRRIVSKIQHAYESGESQAPQPLALDDAEPWSFDELKNACHLTLVIVCAAWCAHIGYGAVARQLHRFVEDTARWDAARTQVAMGVAYMIEVDRREAEEAKKGELH